MLLDELRKVASIEAENSAPADGANTRPAVAKRNWFNRLMCRFGVHDDRFERGSMNVHYQNCGCNFSLEDWDE
jgi:hypothetical protein